MANTNPNPSPPTPSSTAPRVPLNQILLTEDDFKNPSAFVSLLNSTLQQHAQLINQSIGAAGPTVMTNHLDLNGFRILNLGAPASPTDALSHAFAETQYAANVLAPKLEAGGSAPLQSYRRLSDTNQRESSSTFLNDITNTAPTANTSTISAGSPSGGYVSVTVSSGVFSRVDGTVTSYAGLTESLPVPVGGVDVFYIFIQRRSNELFLCPTMFTADTWANRIAASGDGNTLIAVITIKTSGFDAVNSAAGGTNPTTNSGAPSRLFGRL